MKTIRRKIVKILRNPGYNGWLNEYDSRYGKAKLSCGHIVTIGEYRRGNPKTSRCFDCEKAMGYWKASGPKRTPAISK